MNESERDLLARVVTQIERGSDFQHMMARRMRVLREAATQLRTGQGAGVVLAQIREEAPEMAQMLEAC